MPVRRRGREEGTLAHPDNRRLVHNQAGRGGFVALPCPAHRRTERCHARRAALCTSPHTSHAAAFGCTPIPYRAPGPDPFRRAPDAPIAAVHFLSRASQTRRPPNCASPGFALLESRFGLGRPRKPWPTCHCAWRCACTAATSVACTHGAPTGPGHSSGGYCSSSAQWGTLGVYR